MKEVEIKYLQTENRNLLKLYKTSVKQVDEWKKRAQLLYDVINGKLLVEEAKEKLAVWDGQAKKEKGDE